ncbi:selenide, water dikinase SelD [bacterium]|nr:selenide, water dikinase SelD [candidate division CSSED10-310 bacterium]
MSGLDQADDAAVVRIDGSRALIFTTDFFTPVVDDPYDYGAIAAANALSDVYAMGGDVLMALNIAAFPADLPEEIIAEILRGGAEKVREAGAVVAGGHTVDSEEPLFGLAVIGTVDPSHFLEKSGARAGDRMVLTKPLGGGIVTTAFKGEMSLPGHIETASQWMKQLNRTSARRALVMQCRAATDVTGFSLLGHALEIAVHSRCTIRLDASRLPFLPGAREYADQWLFPAGSSRNRQAFQDRVDFDRGLSEEFRTLVFTPETSGGLLVCLAAVDAEQFVSQAVEEGEGAWIVGDIIEGPARILVRGSESSR